MGSKNFFAIVETNLKETIPQRIKAQLKFHNMDSFHMASNLTEQGIRQIEDFARSTLHQILQPDEMIQFYGAHFQKKPELFVFTLGERMHLHKIKQLCEEVCRDAKTFQDKYEVHCGTKSSTEKLSATSEKAGDNRRNINVRNENMTAKRGEFMHLGDIKQVVEEVCKESGNLKMNTKYTVVHTSIEKPTTVSEHNGGSTRNLQVRIQKRIVRRRESGRKNSIGEECGQGLLPEPKLTNICLRNLPAATSGKEIRNLVKSFGPIQRMFVGRNHDSGLCNGFASIDFKFPRDAAKAIETLNGKTHKTSILIASLYTPRNKKTVSSK